ncbi:MAG: hypothetical protein HKM22_02845 [Gammaproteobacteria bacterium]|nr:hypothetical protein [Gammaproteobacteria bacterium]
MKKTCHPLFISLLLVTLVQPAWAEHGWRHAAKSARGERYAAAPSQPISANEAAARVQRQYGGRILAIDTRQRNGQVIYRIKVLTRKGVVRIVRIKAGSRQ